MHDLFIGKMIATYADDQVFRDSHWHYHVVSEEWKSTHHVTGVQFYSIGKAVSVDDSDLWFFKWDINKNYPGWADNICKPRASEIMLLYSQSSFGLMRYDAF